MDALAAGTPPGGRMSRAGSVLVRTALGGVSKPGREDRAMISGRPPSPDAGYFLARPRLDAIADRLPTVTAALVVGSGGYGKSTVMAAWQRRLDVANVTTAWVALAPRDASLSAFVERLGTTLHAALPDLGDSAQRLVDAGISDPVLVARALINELYVVTEERAERLVVFIDDLHCVLDDVATVAFVGEFMREMPPRVHAAFASRRPLTFAPIAKLRNAGRLIEIAERDLRFTADEAAQLVGDRERGDRLATQTQGWTIAVRLGASLAASGGVSFDAIFAGVRDHAFDFLAQEVVAHLAPGDRNDLMTLAIPASFDEATATMLLGRDDAAATIERLVARGVYFENSQAAWQFHQLFREFLLRRMRVEVPEFERAKRRRYSEYLRNRGETVEALGQLIEAGDFLEIVEYVHEATLAIRYSDRLPQLFNLLSQVPDDVKRQKPMLYRLHGLALQRIGRYDAATEQFAACYKAAHALGDRRTKCIALLERGVASGNFRLQGHGTFAASEGYFREALAIAESLISTAVRAIDASAIISWAWPSLRVVRTTKLSNTWVSPNVSSSPKNVTPIPFSSASRSRTDGAVSGTRRSNTRNSRRSSFAGVPISTSVSRSSCKRACTTCYAKICRGRSHLPKMPKRDSAPRTTRTSVPMRSFCKDSARSLSIRRASSLREIFMKICEVRSNNVTRSSVFNTICFEPRSRSPREK